MIIFIKSGRFGRDSIDDICSNKHLKSIIEHLIEAGHQCLDRYSIRSDIVPDVELHFEVQKNTYRSFLVCIQLEHEYIFPANTKANIEAYDAVITWDRSVESNNVFFYLPPVHERQMMIKDFGEREIFSTIIATNRSTNKICVDELYSERVRVIDFYNKFFPERFALFGAGWNLPPQPPGLAYSALYKILRKLSINLRRPLTVYRGLCEDKDRTLNNTKFNFCFENAEGLRGYITEKIFDCFFSGCVPIYCGARDIENYIPKEAFINYRDFNSLCELHLFLESMSEKSYREYVDAALNFINSEKFKNFTSKNFSLSIANNIHSYARSIKR